MIPSAAPSTSNYARDTVFGTPPLRSRTVSALSRPPILARNWRGWSLGYDLVDKRMSMQDIRAVIALTARNPGTDRLLDRIRQGSPAEQKSALQKLLSAAQKETILIVPLENLDLCERIGNHASFVALSSDAQFSCDTACYSAFDRAFARCS
jgi:hypothetical protein